MLCCEECGSNNIGWDAWVDEEGEVINTFDNYMCLDCEQHTPKLIREKESNNEN
jgi:hypothetical protein